MDGNPLAAFGKSCCTWLARLRAAANTKEEEKRRKASDALRRRQGGREIGDRRQEVARLVRDCETEGIRFCA